MEQSYKNDRKYGALCMTFAPSRSNKNNDEFTSCSAYVFSMDNVNRGVRNSSLKILLGNARSMQHELGCILWYWATVKFIYIMNTLYMPRRQ